MNNRRFRWGIREKLTLLFFFVTLIAVTVNFLIVVPRLEQRLRSDRVENMREIANRVQPQVEYIYTNFDPNLVTPAPAGGAWSQYLPNIVGSVGERVAILKPLPTQFPIGPTYRFAVVYDPTGETQTNDSDLIEDPIAERAVETKKKVWGILDFGTGPHAEAAVPLKSANGQVAGVAVYSTSLSGVTTTVQQIARRQLVSAVIALSIALIAGLVASGYMARRLRRLEVAARSVADGNFTEPLVVDSEDEIGEVTRAFNMMQDRLGRADRARKAFIANASHELRTPLFSLGGYVELMREEELDPETQREFLDQMHSQIKRMTRLATDLLDLSKIDTGSLAIQPEHVNLRALARSIAREFNLRAEQQESEIDIEVAGDVEAICDPDRVAQIARILVDNALNHNPPGTDVTIDAIADDTGVALKVSDNGNGIPAEDVGRIFDRFHTGNKTGGTGLGLSIARELAQAMEGSLTVETSPDGTTFTLRLPAGVKINQPI
ncbi:MAG: HAMP domain-containing histidine kinase [Thermoleophilaceae bacterium]|nr:HAMP domain-containing histidine kinase [Thermoleophilaceae bacterium]